MFLKSIDPSALGIKGGGFKKMFEILSSKYRARTHTWNCTITYIGSFGSFAGYAAAFPMMIKIIYGGFDGAPDPLKYAFFGPLIGGLSRALTGGIFDKIGGSKGMFWCFLGQIIGCVALIFGGYLTPTGLEQFPMFVYIMLWIFLMTGINNAATFRQYPIVFAYSAARCSMRGVGMCVRVLARSGRADARLDRRVGCFRPVHLHQSHRNVHHQDRQRHNILRRRR